MNTLISIVLAIVLNFLGVEVQERKLAANPKVKNTEQVSTVEFAKILARDTIKNNASTRLNEWNCTK